MYRCWLPGKKEVQHIIIYIELQVLLFRYRLIIGEGCEWVFFAEVRRTEDEGYAL